MLRSSMRKLRLKFGLFSRRTADDENGAKKIEDSHCNVIAKPVSPAFATEEESEEFRVIQLDETEHYADFKFRGADLWSNLTSAFPPDH